MNKILSTALVCKQIIEKDISITQINHVHQGIKDVRVSGNISNLEASLRSLVDVTKTKYPQISTSLLRYIEKYDELPIRYFGRIEATIECLIDIENNSSSVHRIFISHSSKDERMVKDFVNHILMLGIGIRPEDIFCTSIENMNIRNGEDIRKYIEENIKGADYLFLLLSDNYKQSEICQNEMGAVWINNGRVKYYLLPNFTFEKIGWLTNQNKQSN